MRPLIGVVTYYLQSHEFDNKDIRGRHDQDYMLVSMDYAEAIYEAGGIPLAIPPINTDQYLSTIIERLDGVLLTGGGDIHPRHYNQSCQKGLGKLEETRDLIELKLVEYAMAKQMPIFGVCRGLQLLNVYFKGTLFQDIGRDVNCTVQHAFYKGTKSCKVHRVDFSKDCALKKAVDSDHIYVNSLHHQAIDKLGEGLSVCAKSEDGYIEAIQYDDNPAVFAVQWHPEMMAQVDQSQLALFKLLVDFASDYKQKR